jgi:hypothetical protein
MSDSILNADQVQGFILNGFVRIDNAFSRETAMAAVDLLWNQIPLDRNNPATWTEPLIRLGMFTDAPFIESVNSPSLYKVFDQLVGAGRWEACRSVGAFPIRFPSNTGANDRGNHVDAGFAGEDPNNYFEWRANIRSRGRALLMLILYSDVLDCDAPTAIYKGSHLHVARLLLHHGEPGLSFSELASKVHTLPANNVQFATGNAGTIYLCHPFLVHAAQMHRGREPKFMAQPPLLWKPEFSSGISGGEPRSPVAEAIRVALAN